MANYRLKLSDSVTTLDFYGADYKVLEGGLSLPVPKVKAEYLSSALTDGARMTASKYENRIISIDLKIIGTSLSDL